MAKLTDFLISEFPMAALVCEHSGLILEHNRRACDLFDHSIANQNLASLVDFSKTDLKACESFADVIEVLKKRNAEHHDLLVNHDQQQMCQLSLNFSFIDKDNESYILILLQDASERAKLMGTFDYQQNLLNSIFATSKDALVVFDGDGYIELFSPAAEMIFGKTSSEMTMEDIFCLFDKASRERVTDVLSQLNSSVQGKEVLAFEDLVPIKANGAGFPASVTFYRSHSEANSLFFMVVSDKSLFHKFVNSVNDAYVKTDERGIIIDINGKTESLFEYSREHLINQHLDILEIKKLEPDAPLIDLPRLANFGVGEDDYVSHTQRGQELVMNLTVWPQEVNKVRFNNLIIRDVSQKKRAEQQLRTSACTDSLTSLYNRAHFSSQINALVLGGADEPQQFTLLSVDLDKFKNINDSFGHDYGDDLLILASQRLKSCVREHDLVFRMGGDEFNVLIVGCICKEAVDEIAERILREILKEYPLKQKRVSVSASIGIAMFPNDGDTPEEIIKAADIALYSVKRNGKNGFRYFTQEMNQENERKKLIERELLGGSVKDEFQLYFQPKISVSRNCVVGFEALLRWNSPVLGFVSPGEFIPIAEDCGKIVDITRWVLKTGIQSMKRLEQKCGKNGFSLAINISAKHFKDDLFADLECALKHDDFKPNQLEIEITEGLLLEHTPVTIETLRKINELGVHICMDDFGTGYSSMHYLKDFTVDTLKIDRSFVKEIEREPQLSIIIESIVYIAKRLKLDLVVEGVETQMELAEVVSLGCDVIQGYFFSKPIPESDIVEFLKHLESNPFPTLISKH